MRHSSQRNSYSTKNTSFLGYKTVACLVNSALNNWAQIFYANFNFFCTFSQNSLQLLMDKLQKAEPHFVR